MGMEVRRVLGDLVLKNEDIDLIVPNTANRVIIESLAQHLSVPMSQVALNIQKYGNTSAATIPVAIVEALEAGRIQPGDRLLLAAFGAGSAAARGRTRVWVKRCGTRWQTKGLLAPW